MRIVEAAAGLGIPLQINSTVARLTYPHLRTMAARMRELPIVLWAVFFLIATGRGSALEQITPDECEEVLQFLAELAGGVPFAIKTTEAPHYQRVLLQTARNAEAPRTERVGGTYAGEPAQAPAAARRPAGPRRAVTDGNGFVFIDHLGQICPSGFLPEVCGSVRHGSLLSVYREHELFLRLRDPDRLEGKCGRCEYRTICGGSRARAYAATGSPCGSDPLCPYEPAGRTLQ
jgi:radical SAM protein with 4Fe4S-binding SPASM domain